MIAILVCGGTFDKKYDEITGRLFFKDTHVAEMLRLGRSRVAVTVETLMMIDSLEMTDADRARDRRALPDVCRDRDRHHARDRHDGRDRCGPRPPCPRKTIVLTGAMIPYAFGSSDGLFNLGSALSFAQALPAGVYVAMNGTAFPWNDVPEEPGERVFSSVRCPPRLPSAVFSAFPSFRGWLFWPSVHARLAPFLAEVVGFSRRDGCVPRPDTCFQPFRRVVPSKRCDLKDLPQLLVVGTVLAIRSHEKQPWPPLTPSLAV